jgi:hypothetical protein
MSGVKSSPNEPMERTVAAGAGETAKLRAGSDKGVAEASVADAKASGRAAKVNTALSKSRYSRSAGDNTRLNTPGRRLRYSADMPAPAQSDAAEPEQQRRHCFLFCNR